MQPQSRHILAHDLSGQLSIVTLRIPYILAAAVAAVSFLYLASPPELRAAPVLTVTSLDGEQLNLAAKKGKTRLVTFISPDCAVSKKNLSVLESIQNHYASELEVVGITMPYDTATNVDNFRQENDIGFLLVADADGSIADAFVQVRFTPTSFLIDGAGNISQRIVGRLQIDELRQQIDSLHAQPAVRLSQ